MDAAVMISCMLHAAASTAIARAEGLPTPIWDPVAHQILRWNDTWPMFRNAAGNTTLLPAPQAISAYVTRGGEPIGGMAQGHLNGGYNSRYYLKKGDSEYGTLDRNTMMRQFQEGMAVDAAQSPLPVGVTEPMLVATGLAEGWDTAASCARVSAPELTDRSALVLVVDRFPASKGGKNDSKVDMTWDLASLFVSAITASSRCWDGMNVYDTRSGKPCIELQFVECSFHDPAGTKIPVTAGFIYPTQSLGHGKFNLKFQLNYKERPVRAVQVVSADGKTKDAEFAYGAWQVSHMSGAPFRIRVSYGSKDGSGNYIYQTSQPLSPPTSVARKTSWPSDRYKQGDFSHVENIALQFSG